MLLRKSEIHRKKLRSELINIIRKLPPGVSVEERRVAAKRSQIDFIKSIFLKKPYLLTNEDYFLSMLVDSKWFDPYMINPQLVLCSCREEFDIYDYMRMWSSFPTHDRPGRRMKFLIRDTGHQGSPIMGICAISSPVRHLKVLDQ